MKNKYIRTFFSFLALLFSSVVYCINFNNFFVLEDYSGNILGETVEIHDNLSFKMTNISPDFANKKLTMKLYSGCELSSLESIQMASGFDTGLSLVFSLTEGEEKHIYISKTNNFTDKKIYKLLIEIEGQSFFRQLDIVFTCQRPSSTNAVNPYGLPNSARPSLQVQRSFGRTPTTPSRHPSPLNPEPALLPEHIKPFFVEIASKQVKDAPWVGGDVLSAIGKSRRLTIKFKEELSFRITLKKPFTLRPSQGEDILCLQAEERKKRKDSSSSELTVSNKSELEFFLSLVSKVNKESNRRYTLEISAYQGTISNDNLVFEALIPIEVMSHHYESSKKKALAQDEFRRNENQIFFGNQGGESAAE